MPGWDLATTSRRANLIRELISSTQIRTPVQTTTVTVSMGVAVAESATSSESLLRRADLALYQAKRNRRNRVEETVATAGESRRAGLRSVFRPRHLFVTDQTALESADDLTSKSRTVFQNRGSVHLYAREENSIL